MAVSINASLVLAQDGAPPPRSTDPAPQPDPSPEPMAEPAPQPQDPVAPVVPEVIPTPAQDGATPEYRPDRRVMDDALVPVNFKDQKVEDLLPIIVEYTGKTVLLKSGAIRTIQLTIMNDKLVTKQQALELIFQALRLNDVGVVETPEFLMFDALSNISKLQPITVLGPSVDVSRMADSGQIVTKVWQIKHTKASSVFDRINTSLPDYGKLDVDNASNQLILEGDVGLAKRCQKMIEILDVQPYQDIRTETFRLHYADAELISGVILDLFSSSRASGGASSANRGQQQNAARGTRQQTSGGQEQVAVGTSESLLVSVIPATNSITVRAEPDIMEDIGGLIRDVWDVDPQRDGSLFKTYQLLHTDPLKIQAILQSLLAAGGTSNSTGGGQNRGGGRVAGAQGGGGDTGADAAVANIFKIEAYPDSNRLVILSKTPDNFVWLDQMVEELDQPILAGVPRIVELKYASAIDVSEMVNAILAPEGGNAEISAPEEGLSGINFETAGSGSDASSSGAADAQGVIRFPWQRGGGANGDSPQAEVSALIGKSRIVPNAGQNTVMVLAPPEITDALIAVIQELDKPGRQVMIEAVLAEVELGDQFAMGVQFGPTGTVETSNSASSLISSNTIDYERDNIDFINNFTNYLFVGGVDFDVVLQALAQKTSVRILQKPKVFTSDNKEAKFFSGQDIPFQSGSTSDSAGTTASFDSIPVGIGLNVRPRITADGMVAMEIEVLLSNRNNASSATLQAGGNPVIDRRQTNTTVTVRNGNTVVLSGIRIETENTSRKGIPFLSDIPVLGYLFGADDNVSAVKELLIFLRPVVLERPEDSNQLNGADLLRLEALKKTLTDETKKLILEDGGKEDIGPREVVPAPAPAPDSTTAP